MLIYIHRHYAFVNASIMGCIPMISVDSLFSASSVRGAVCDRGAEGRDKIPPIVGGISVWRVCSVLSESEVLNPRLRIPEAAASRLRKWLLLKSR